MELSIAEHTMSSSDPILDLATVGEVAGVFHSQKDIDVAVNALMLSGFDRSQADVIDSLDQLRQKPEGSEKLTSVTLRRRRPFITREDFTLLNVLIASIVGAVSVAIDLDDVASGESGLAVGVDTILVGFAFAGISSLLTTRLLRREQTDSLGALLARRGLILRVRVRSSQQEGKAQEILRVNKAEYVRRP
jgi:hypothetical protein